MKNVLMYLKVIVCINTCFVLGQSERPQEQLGTQNYRSEEVLFYNPLADSIKLAGTLTLPNNIQKPPVAILISGSGPQDRDSYVEAFGHKPFLVLSDYLTKHGIAVLRYDDRGVGKSEGEFGNCSSFDFATDVQAAYSYLKNRKDINTENIGLIGHSEGGLIAPIVASTNKDIAFIILLAAPGVDGGEILQSQSRKALELRGTPKMVLDENEKLSQIVYNAVRTYKVKDTLKQKIADGLNGYKKEHPMSIVSSAITPVLIEQQYKILESKWLLNFIRTDPKTYLKNVNCPVLALNGDKDVQVVSKVNLPEIKDALSASKNNDVTAMELKDLNHLFQTAETGHVSEYKTILETFSPNAMDIIYKWIDERFSP